MTGSLPPELGSCTKLKSIDVEGNRLKGTVSDKVATLPFLEDLYLASNQFTGVLPTLTSPHLLVVSLEKNHFTGPISFPASNLAASNLTHYLLSENALTGTIPVELNSLSNLLDFFCQNNRLNGALPNLSGMSALQRLTLQNNSFTGQVGSS